MFLTNQVNACMEWTSQNTHIPDVCSLFHGSKIIRRIDENSYADELCISVNDHNERTYEFTVPVATIVDHPTLLATFVGKGLALSYYMVQSLSEYLMNDYRECKKARRVEYRHKRLGWHTYQGQDYFLYDQTQIGNTLSKCTRTNFRFTGGDEATYRQFLTDTVYPVPTLALAMAIGYSAPVVTRLKDYADTGTIIVNLCGASSTGKTTVEQLLVSPFACPMESNKDGLIRTFHATSNALFAGISGIYGLPIVLDDVTTNPNLDLPNLIYTLASGEQKGRCNGEGELRQDGDGWHGVVVISSETPIQDCSSQNQGLTVRVLQTQGITWTPDAKTAELIKRTVKKNYGFTGREFAEYVGKLPYDKLCQAFDVAQDKVHELMTNRDGLSDRLEAKYAAIYLTILLMNQCFRLNLKGCELISILLKPEQDGVQDRDISAKALDCVRDFIIQKRSHFHELIDQNTPNAQDRQAIGDKYGIIRQKGVACDVFITPNIVDELLRTRGIFEIATVKKRWRDNGIILADSGRLNCKYLGSRYVHFVFTGGLVETTSPIPQKSVSPMTNSIPQISIPADNSSIEEIFGA